MKQLTILCSADLSEQVQEALVRAGAEGFLHVPNAVGTKPGAAAEHGRWPHWQAEMFLAPVDEAVLERAVAALREHAARCAVEPCLRILVTPLEAVY